MRSSDRHDSRNRVLMTEQSCYVTQVRQQWTLYEQAIRTRTDYMNCVSIIMNSLWCSIFVVRVVSCAVVVEKLLVHWKFPFIVFRKVKGIGPLLA